MGWGEAGPGMPKLFLPAGFEQLSLKFYESLSADALRIDSGGAKGGE